MRYKRLLKLEGDFGSVAVLRISGKENVVTISVSLIEKQYADAKIFLYDGKTYYLAGDGEILDGADFSLKACCVCVSKRKIVATASYGGLEIDEEGFLSFEKNIENGVKNEKGEYAQDIYDDEKIAEENYYEKGGLDEEQIVFNAEAEKNYRYEKEDGIKAGNASENEEDLSFKEHSADAFNAESGYPFTERDCKKELYEFYKIVAGKTRARDLENMIQGSVFYKMGGEKFYLFGLIENLSFPVYFCYAVPSKKGNPPKGFEKGYFVPKSYFDCQNGYYCLFQRAKKA